MSLRDSVPTLRRWQSEPPQSRWAKVGEWSVLSMLALAVTTIPLGLGEITFVSLNKQIELSWGAENLGGPGLVLGLGAPLLGLLILTRLIRRPALLFAAALAWFVLVYGLIWWIKERPLLSEMAMDPYGLIGPPKPFLIPWVTYRVVGLLAIILPIVAALLACRRLDCFWRYGAVWLAATALVLLVFYHPSAVLGAVKRVFDQPGKHWPTLGLLVPSVVFFALAVYFLPGQRAALRRLLDSDRPEGVDPAWARGAATLLAGALLLLAFTIPVGLNHLERKIGRAITGVYDLPPRPTGALNARVALKPLFHRLNAPQLPALGQGWQQLVVRTGGGTVTDFTDEDVALIESLAPTFDPYVLALREAAGADYLRFSTPEPGVPSFLNLRETARYINARACLQLHRGEYAEALEEMDLLLRIARLMNGDDSGSLVTHMIAAAIRGIALGTLRQHYLTTRENPAEAERFAAWMSERRQLLRVIFPIEILRVTEFGFWRFAAHYEIAVPGMTRAMQVFYRAWAEADLIELALASDRFERAQGRLPGSLDELAPEFLARIPVDPTDGGAYIYAVHGDGFVIERPVFRRPNDTGHARLAVGVD